MKSVGEGMIAVLLLPNDAGVGNTVSRVDERLPGPETDDTGTRSSISRLNESYASAQGDFTDGIGDWLYIDTVAGLVFAGVMSGLCDGAQASLFGGSYPNVSEP